MHEYIEKVIADVKRENASEPEFIQTVEEVLRSLEPVIRQHPEYVKANILGRLVEPERMISFRVCWTDDNGDVQVNRGYRVQFNSAIGPYKGGLRFHPTVYSGIVKFLGFEQIFKNALTGLMIGGGKGGANFDPRGKSDAEIMRFCQAFMTELYRHIGSNLDVPAGDIGVGGKEIGYLFGQYKRIRGGFENGVLTGKSTDYGGSLIRPESTGYGAVYFTQHLLAHEGTSFEGKIVSLTGYGNVTWGAAIKINELGGKVVTISGSDGYVYDPDGISGEKVDYLLYMRDHNTGAKAYAEKYPTATFYPKEKPWGKVPDVDIYMPCATQNEISLEEAKAIVAQGVKYVIEVSNMPCTNDAIEYMMQHGVVMAPSKAVNAGGVAVSALEMSQNSQRMLWTAEEVDQRLSDIMQGIHDNAAAAAEQYGLGYNLMAGANLAGFEKVARA
ncbi:MAG: NADP-specific glutamate dehydrogenase, partial [Peptococcaceae bacterium]|nr:NADP-specific glutamate dehydrogenase [Peptococcaceae bacterium]